jgi:S-DNA-T family DNA segregation ATPase FtsK/SpoIIIE
MSKKRAKKKPSSKAIRISFSDERVRKILGVILVFIALYLTIAFVSYFFKWEYDQDKILKLSGDILFDPEVKVQNWLGRLGAFTSHMFFYWGFGLCSFGFIFLIVRLGLDLIRQASLKTYANVFLHTFIIMTFFSVVLEFLFSNSEFCWGGLMGNSICGYLSSFLGQVGLVLFMILLVVAAFIWLVNPLIQLDGLKMAHSFENISIPKFDFNFGKNDFTSAVAEPKPKKERKRKSLFEDLDGSMPKTEGVEEVSTKSDEPIELKLPDSTPTKPKKKQNTEDYFDTLKLDVAESAPADSADGATTAPQGPKPVGSPKAVGPDMDSDALYVTEDNPDDFEPYDPTKELSKYKFPEFDSLIDYDTSTGQIDRSELEENKNQIVKTLLNYNIKITKIKATIGPTVTLYEIVPAPGVKISSIKKLEDDIALSLAALGIRIIAPIPGRGTVGIEVPNKNKQIVSFKEVASSDKFKTCKMDLPIVLGKTISNEIFVADLAKMPHLLIAGATGQGKSVGINTVLMSLLYKKHPSQVKLVMIDPKKVELYPYSYLDKHFLGYLPDSDEPIVTDTKKVIQTLTSLTVEMDDRYDLLKKARARNIKEYNEKFVARKISPKDGHKFLPFIVLVIDEFADLIMTAGKEIEMPIARLAQLARAIGIHLIIATQRPSVKIITGMIKANFPARIAFKVTSQIDSRTILDAKGAEQLIGKGDMLLSVGSDIVRLQCAFVDTPEVEAVIQHISDQKGFAEPYHLPEVADENSEMGGSNLKWSDLDPMFEEATRLIVSSQHGSTSSIQRKMQLGYNRAGRIMDQMESLGIVGEANGSKPRQVLFTSETELMHYLEHLKSGKS